MASLYSTCNCCPISAAEIQIQVTVIFPSSPTNTVSCRCDIVEDVVNKVRFDTKIVSLFNRRVCWEDQRSLREFSVSCGPSLHITPPQNRCGRRDKKIDGLQFVRFVSRCRLAPTRCQSWRWLAPRTFDRPTPLRSIFVISCVVILVLRYFILGRFFHFRYPAKREVQDNLGHEMPRFVLVENKLKFIASIACL